MNKQVSSLFPFAGSYLPNPQRTHTIVVMWRKQGQQTAETWSVSELTSYIRELFEIDFRLQDVNVAGELSNFTRARSGHLYFTLKDGDAQIKCVMWRSDADRLRFDPQGGDAVQCRGRVSVYEAGGNYQLYVKRMQLAGIGDLAQAFERLKNQLTEEGLFDPEHKQPLPPFPATIGIVTSPDAAALRDILNVLRRRYPLAKAILSPTLVQGVEAPAQIVAAIQQLDAHPEVEIIILARGGGSIEDLWAFNDEAVARTIFAAQKPLISGVGHETDFTIADFVADVRAPTPSVAAEIATPDMMELAQFLGGAKGALDAGIIQRIQRQQDQVDARQRALTLLSPQAKLEGARQSLDMLSFQLEHQIKSKLQTHETRLQLAAARLAAINPQAALQRGYAIVRQKNGSVVRSINEVNAGDPLQIQVADGEFGATANE